MINRPFAKLVIACSIDLLLSACAFADAADAQPDWKQTGVLAAPEAVQAAAADERCAYAIANAQVAKYNRLTGAREAFSSGDAKHLNSGFLWQGHLYCAHSNYPQTPERSEIKVLDTKTMRLSTFKDFGSFGGSLTWVVHQDGYWWCNFARYGADNGQTFLVKFDAAWNEQGRWTFPREVIDELGTYSISGGIWRDGHWFVTGHDDPVLFRVRLPAQGSVLEFVDKQRAPFTGQGIASDPKTGALVGINRAKRQVVFASQSENSRVSPRLNAAWKRHVIDDSSKGADGVRLADINGDGRPDIATGWEQGGAVRLCLNPGPARVKEKWPAVGVGNLLGVEDAVSADLDGDGNADVVSCAEGKSRVISIHWAPQKRDHILDANQWRTEPLPASVNAMMWMFALPLQVDGKYGTDLVAGGKGAGASLGWFEAPPEPRKLADWQWHELRRVGWLMSIVASDMDGDGDSDIVFSDRKGQRSGAYWLENPGANAPPRRLEPWKEHMIGGVGQEAMFLHLADLDRDGLEDVLLAVQPKEILWLRRLDRSGLNWQPNSISLTEPTGIAKAVSAGDIDGDGKLDLVFSCEQSKPPAHGLMWLSATGPPNAGKWTAHVLSGSDGVKHDLVELTDLDADGDLDVITTEEVKDLGVIWYENPVRP